MGGFVGRFTSSNENVTISRLHSDSKDPRVREIAYRVYLSPDKHQENLLGNMLIARHNLAKLCGFETYGHR